MLRRCSKIALRQNRVDQADFSKFLPVLVGGNICARHISRYDHIDKNPGSGRTRGTLARRRPLQVIRPNKQPDTISMQSGTDDNSIQSDIWDLSQARISGQPDEALRHLLSNNTLVITRYDRQQHHVFITIHHVQDSSRCLMSSSALSSATNTLLVWRALLSEC